MAADPDADRARWAALGLGTITPNSGLNALEQLLDEGPATSGALPIEWSKFLRQFPPGNRPPLLEVLSREVDERRKAAELGQNAPACCEKLAAADPAAQIAILTEFVDGQVARTLGIEPARNRRRNSRCRTWASIR